MAHIALVAITPDTDGKRRVKNVATAPNGTNIYFVPEGYEGISSETAGIGDAYDPVTGKFTPPAPIDSVE